MLIKDLIEDLKHDYYYDPDFFGYIFVFTIILIWFAIITTMIIVFISGYMFQKTEEITVKDKYVKFKSNDSKYLIVDTDNEAYEITDQFWIGKFNSTDIYNQLEIGKKYKIKIRGVRNHLFSKYKNIEKVEEVK